MRSVPASGYANPTSRNCSPQLVTVTGCIPKAGSALVACPSQTQAVSAGTLTNAKPAPGIEAPGAMKAGSPTGVARGGPGYSGSASIPLTVTAGWHRPLAPATFCTAICQMRPATVPPANIPLACTRSYIFDEIVTDD